MLKCVQEYLPLIESFCVIIGVIFVAIQIRQQAKIAQADHDRQKKQSTIEFYDSISSDSYQLLDNMNGKPDKKNSADLLWKNIIRYLSKLERLAVGVASDIYDFEILCLISGRFLSEQYERFEKYIVEARKDKDAPMRFKEFELLVDRIDEHRKKNPEQIVGEPNRVAQP